MNQSQIPHINDPDRMPRALEHLRDFLTPERRGRIESVLEFRTNYITLALEDIYDPQNASAVIRSCEAHGVQSLHITEQNHVFDLKRKVVQGADKWMHLHRYNQRDGQDTERCYKHLKDSGYQILATSPHDESLLLPDVDLSKPTAIVLGRERDGLTDYAFKNADGYLKIPMVGFTESFNLSVSAALVLNSLTTRLHRSEDINWRLKPEERMRLEYEWIYKSIGASEKILERFFKDD